MRQIPVLLSALAFAGCALFTSAKSDIRDFDRAYLKDKYVGKTGWASVDLGGLKRGDKLVISSLEFGPRTIVRVKSAATDFFFYVYSNKNLEAEVKPGEKVEYDLRAIEKEITDRIGFLAPDGR